MGIVIVTVKREVQLVAVEVMAVVGAVVGLIVIEIEIGVVLLTVLGLMELESASVDCSDDFSCKRIGSCHWLYNCKKHSRLVVGKMMELILCNK